MEKVSLKDFDNSWFDDGGVPRRITWFIVNAIFLKSAILWPGFVRKFVLKLYGAKIGKGVLIKPRVNVKFPWNLSIGDHTWIGENVWIENQDSVSIGANCCLSQGVLILSGNHDYKKPTFDLMIKPIVIEDGAWIGARATICQGAIIRSHAVLTVGAVTSGELNAYSIYSGSPAVFVRERKIG